MGRRGRPDVRHHDDGLLRLDPRGAQRRRARLAGDRPADQLATVVGVHQNTNASRKDPARADTASGNQSVDDDEHLAAYNDYLARLNKQHDRLGDALGGHDGKETLDKFMVVDPAVEDRAATYSSGPTRPAKARDIRGMIRANRERPPPR